MGAPDHPPAPHDAGEADALDAPDPPPSTHATGEGWDATDAPGSAPPTRPPGTEERGDHGRAGVTSTRRRGGRNALDILDHPQRQHDTGTPWMPADPLPPFARRYDLYYLLRLLC